MLLDIAMPGMDGLTCLELIRRRHPEVKVVMLSGSQETEQIQAALKRGASAYIVKTVDPIELPAILRQVAATTSPSADSQVWGRQEIEEDRTAFRDFDETLLVRVRASKRTTHVPEEL